MLSELSTVWPNVCGHPLNLPVHCLMTFIVTLWHRSIADGWMNMWLGSQVKVFSFWTQNSSTTTFPRSTQRTALKVQKSSSLSQKIKPVRSKNKEPQPWVSDLRTMGSIYCTASLHFRGTLISCFMLSHHKEPNLETALWKWKYIIQWVRVERQLETWRLHPL